MVRAAAPAAARARVQQHRHPQRHHSVHAALRLDDVAGLVRQPAILGGAPITRFQLDVRERVAVRWRQHLPIPHVQRGRRCRRLGTWTDPMEGSVCHQRRAHQVGG